MQVSTAIKQIQKEADFLGMGFLETLQFINDNPLAQPQRTLEAYRVFVSVGSHMFAPVDQ